MMKSAKRGANKPSQDIKGIESSKIGAGWHGHCAKSFHTTVLDTFDFGPRMNCGVVWKFWQRHNCDTRGWGWCGMGERGCRWGIGEFLDLYSLCFDRLGDWLWVQLVEMGKASHLHHHKSLVNHTSNRLLEIRIQRQVHIWNFLCFLEDLGVLVLSQDANSIRVRHTCLEDQNHKKITLECNPVIPLVVSLSQLLASKIFQVGIWKKKESRNPCKHTLLWRFVKDFLSSSFNLCMVVNSRLAPRKSKRVAYPSTSWTHPRVPSFRAKTDLEMQNAPVFIWKKKTTP